MRYFKFCLDLIVKSFRLLISRNRDSRLDAVIQILESAEEWYPEQVRHYALASLAAMDKELEASSPFTGADFDKEYSLSLAVMCDESHVARMRSVRKRLRKLAGTA